VGLNRQVVSAGSFEHENVTLFGNAPVVGFTSIMKLAGCPAGIELLGGVMPMVKSKFWLGIAVKVTDAECVIAEGSLPTPAMLKLYVCDTLLETMTVKGMLAAVGVTLAGLATQLEGAAAPQLSPHC
jgi:hypothetical protein